MSVIERASTKSLLLFASKMPGSQHAIDAKRCRNHAHFMSRLSEDEANAVFWSMFILIITMAVVVSISFSEAQKQYE